MLTEEERKIQEILLVFDGINISNIRPCGDCNAGLHGTFRGAPSDRIFKHNESENLYVRPCIEHLHNYIKCTWFDEVEL